MASLEQKFYIFRVVDMHRELQYAKIGTRIGTYERRSLKLYDLEEPGFEMVLSEYRTYCSPALDFELVPEVPHPILQFKSVMECVLEFYFGRVKYLTANPRTKSITTETFHCTAEEAEMYMGMAKQFITLLPYGDGRLPLWMRPSDFPWKLARGQHSTIPLEVLWEQLAGSLPVALRPVVPFGDMRPTDVGLIATYAGEHATAALAPVSPMAWLRLATWTFERHVRGRNRRGCKVGANSFVTCVLCGPSHKASTLHLIVPCKMWQMCHGCWQSNERCLRILAFLARGADGPLQYHLLNYLEFVLRRPRKRPRCDEV